MRRYGMLLLVLVLASASLLAAAAYNSAMVSNASSMVMITTEAAHLALRPNPVHEANGFVGVTDGKLWINFAAVNSGFQPNSSYFFDDLFFVKNNLTSGSIKMGMRFDSVYPGQQWLPGLHTVSTNKVSDWYYPTNPSYDKALMHGSGAFQSGWYEGRKITLTPGEEIGIDWSFIIGNQALGTFSKTLQVFGAQITL